MGLCGLFDWSFSLQLLSVVSVVPPPVSVALPVVPVGLVVPPPKFPFVLFVEALSAPLLLVSEVESAENTGMEHITRKIKYETFLPIFATSFCML